MKLRSKALLIAGIALVSLIAVLYVFATTIVLNGFARIEEQYTRENVERALSAVSDELSNLSSINRDYASWDDTYTFIEDANDDYSKVNLVDTTFTNLRLNLMVFIHSSGRVVFSKAFDLQNDRKYLFRLSCRITCLPIARFTALWPRDPTDSSPEGPTLPRPILTSEYKGQFMNSCLRTLPDSAEIERCPDHFTVSQCGGLTIRDATTQKMPSLFEETLTYPPTERTIHRRVQPDGDIYEKPALC
jgi:hypothetical protein